MAHAIDPNHPAAIFVGNAALGAFSAWAFTTTSAWGGFVFGGVFGIVQVLTEKAGDACFGRGECAKIMTFVLSHLAAIAAAATATTALGVSMTFEAGFTLAIAMMISAVALACLCGGGMVIAAGQNRG